MIKRNLKIIILTGIIILLPMVAGLLLWDKLPERIPVHFGVHGEPDGWSLKAFAVLGLPLFLLGLQLLCLLGTCTDPKKDRISDKMLSLVLWIIPVVSVVLETCMLLISLGHEINMYVILMLLMGVFFIIMGNYMPKMRQSYTLGIKLPWTLESTENWNKTHRLGGVVFVVAGVVTLALAFFVSLWWVFWVIIGAVGVIPALYSFYLHKKGI